ncbi:MAG: hypothetical protein KIT27_06605 [Legionellales bacterium]|nr:hypothetical protein [Legionellales bacterium]
MSKHLFAQQAVFTLQEFYDSLIAQGSQNQTTQYNLLRYYLSKGKLIKIQRGLFAVVPDLFTPETVNVDPYLITGKLTGDAIIAYHTALQFHGVAYTVYQQFYFLTRYNKKLFYFHDHTFQGVAFPKILITHQQENVATDTVTRQGVKLRITSLERTIVDVLDKPELGGGWEDILASFEMVGVLNIQKLIDYALLLNNATLISKVGFFLEKYQKNWGVSEQQLNLLMKYLPKSKHYLIRNKRGSGKYFSRWKLVIPNRILRHHGEEF